MGRGNLAPAYHNALHALELALKAALSHRLPEVPRTHNVGGLFAQHYRGQVDDATCRRINRLVRDYDLPRYPDWEPHDGVADDIAFINSFVSKTVPGLLEVRA